MPSPEPQPAAERGTTRAKRRRAQARSAATRKPASSWLTPILVDYASRDGSTLMMRLLQSSPQVAVEPPYPFEQKYFTYLVRWSRLLDRPDWPRNEWSGGNLGSIHQDRHLALLGPPPWNPRPSFAPGPRQQSMSTQCFRFAWREFSRRAALAASGGDADRAEEVRFYAEKHLYTWKVDLAELPPLRVIVLLRDPRDVFASIRSVNAVREPEGTPLIGRARGETEESWLDRFLTSQKERLRWIAEIEDDERWHLVRYEDLIADLAEESRRLERLLAIRLDPEAVLRDEELYRRHATSPSGEDSVGRWRRDLSRSERKRITAAIGEEMETLGFAV